MIRQTPAGLKSYDNTNLSGAELAPKTVPFWTHPFRPYFWGQIGSFHFTVWSLGKRGDTEGHIPSNFVKILEKEDVEPVETQHTSSGLL